MSYQKEEIFRLASPRPTVWLHQSESVAAKDLTDVFALFNKPTQEGLYQALQKL